MSKECYEYMNTKEAKERILNPEGHTPIMDVPVTKSFSKEILKRIELYLETHLKSGYVLEIFNDIHNENVAFYKRISRDLTEMEVDWTDEIGKTILALISSGGLDLPFFLDLSLSILAVVVTFIATVVALVLSPIIGPILFFFYSAEKKKALKRECIDEVYYNCMESMESQICEQFHASIGKTLKITSKKMYCETLTNEISRLKKMIQNLKHSREEILSNMESFKDLAKQVERMNVSALDL